ncbi:septum formation initiator family protein [uncultured Fusobacterium sp.]|uniref:septum formation initiator family protein n=1 Tax=uncultured Fusobacterium sp. TaxID=159267 RepID=UPI0015A5DA01|nr:septum formation initiator family protein [uncultured Fusobacterium sp.]
MNLKRVGLVLIVLSIVVGVTPRIYKSFVKIQKLTSELNLLKHRKQELNDEIRRYKINTDRLKDDFYKEKEVREKLKMVKPGEHIYKVLVK